MDLVNKISEADSEHKALTLLHEDYSETLEDVINERCGYRQKFLDTTTANFQLEATMDDLKNQNLAKINIITGNEANIAGFNDRLEQLAAQNARVRNELDAELKLRNETEITLSQLVVEYERNVVKLDNNVKELEEAVADRENFSDSSDIVITVDDTYVEYIGDSSISPFQPLAGSSAKSTKIKKEPKETIKKPIPNKLSPKKEFSLLKDFMKKTKSVPMKELKNPIKLNPKQESPKKTRGRISKIKSPSKVKPMLMVKAVSKENIAPQTSNSKNVPTFAEYVPMYKRERNFLA